jgi:hypothetical protein
MNAPTSRDATVAELSGFPARLEVAVHAASDRPVPAGSWSPIEVVRHLIAVETDVHQARLDDLSRAGTPAWRWEEPTPWLGEPDLTLSELLDRFATLRATTLRTVDRLADADWDRAGVHAVLGALDVTGLLANAVDHDGAHLQDLILP